MLMQSSVNTIKLLPALPTQWKNGSVQGVCARGGFVVDMKWKDRKVIALTISARKGGMTTVQFNGMTKRISLKSGEKKKLL